MTDRFDRLLRDTVHDLAADADVITDRDRRRLALHAADEAHTRRARRRGAIAAVVTLVTALAVGLPYGLRYLSSPTSPPVVALPAGVADLPGVPTHVIDDASEPIELVDGWYVLGNNLVLDRATNTYRGFGNVHETLPSPDGRWVATAGGTGAYRVYDLHNGGSRRYDWRSLLDTSFTVGWSPRSDLLLLSSAPFEHEDPRALDAEPRLVLDFIDVARAEIRRQTIDLTDLACGRCQVIWLPTGDELGIVSHPRGGAGPEAIQVLDLDGQRLRTLPVRGYPLGPQAWSPDGRYVVVTGVSETGDWAGQLVEAATGDVVAGWEKLASAARAQWIDNERFLTLEPVGNYAGTHLRTMISLWSLDGRLLERWIPPIDVVQYPAATDLLAVQLR